MREEPKQQPFDWKNGENTQKPLQKESFTEKARRLQTTQWKSNGYGMTEWKSLLGGI